MSYPWVFRVLSWWSKWSQVGVMLGSAKKTCSFECQEFGRWCYCCDSL